MALNPSLHVAFVDGDDVEWLIANDSSTYISADLVREKARRNEYIVARLGNEYAGYIRLSYFWSFIPFLDVVAVEEEYQRQGIGRAMVTFIEDHARSQGRKLILSSSQADEPGPQAWHRKVGFRDAGAFINLEPVQQVPEILFVKRVAGE